MQSCNIYCAVIRLLEPRTRLEFERSEGYMSHDDKATCYMVRYVYMRQMVIL